VGGGKPDHRTAGVPEPKELHAASERRRIPGDVFAVHVTPGCLRRTGIARRAWDNFLSPGRSAAVAYLLWEQMVAGSIPAAPTRSSVVPRNSQLGGGSPVPFRPERRTLMRAVRTFSFLTLFLLCAAGGFPPRAALAQEIENWSAPPTWSPPRAAGIGTMSTSSPLPFIPITPCRVADTRGNGAPI